MRRPMGPLVLAVLFLMGNVLLVGPLRAAAQEFPIMPDPAACQVDPRPTDEVLALWYDTAGNPIGPAATPSVGTTATLLTIPVGPSADAATIEAITIAVTDLFACFAAGDFPRALALMTDKLAQSFSPGLGASIDDARAFLEAPSEPEPAGEGPSILAVTDVMLLADGRVGAFVVIQENGVGDVAYLVFSPDDAWWLWDEDVHFAPWLRGDATGVTVGAGALRTVPLAPRFWAVSTHPVSVLPNSGPSSRKRLDRGRHVDLIAGRGVAVQFLLPTIIAHA